MGGAVEEDKDGEMVGGFFENGDGFGFGGGVGDRAYLVDLGVAAIPGEEVKGPVFFVFLGDGIVFGRFGAGVSRDE